MTTIPRLEPDSGTFTGLGTTMSSAARAGACPPGLGRALGAGAVAALLVVSVVAGVAITAARGPVLTGLTAAGAWLLLGAAVIGLPHGALDTMLRAQSARQLPGQVVSGLAYLGCAAAVYVLWRRYPAPAVSLLLVVSVAHFAISDWAVTRWRCPQMRRPDHRITARVATVGAAASAVLAVSGPFAWWPSLTSVLLGRLNAANAAGTITLAARWLTAIGLLAALGVAVTLWQVDRVAAMEPVTIAALTATCPPLVAFACYFAAWHSLRQSARLLALEPTAARRLATDGRRAGAVVLVRRTALPTLVALILLAGLVISGRSASAAVLAGLLAISVPHTAVGTWREHADRSNV